MKSNMIHNFAQSESINIERSTFKRDFSHKTTFDAGYLVPVYVDRAMPGDTFNLKMNAFARLATPLKPLMDNMFLDSFFFAVPYRLVHDNFVKMMGEQVDPDDSIDYMLPIMTCPAGAGVVAGSLSDYMGIPQGIGSLSFVSLWHRAYNLIWNTWFRDQNLQDSVVVDRDDGPDNYTDYVLLRRNKRPDYFTTCLPFVQKGPDVLLPLGSTAPVVRVTNANGWTAFDHGAQTRPGVANMSIIVGNELYADSKGRISLDPNGGLVANLSSATASTINALREAFQLQRMYERDARGGTRYTEIVRSHFRVVSPDARLQRPEYLGGGSTPINIHPVAQTSVSAATPQGNLAAFGTAACSGHGFVKSFTEHTLLIGLVSVRADLHYQQGMDRMFFERDRLDHYFPALSHLGEQAVLNKELYATGGASDELPFGYQERFAHLRYKNSLITGRLSSRYSAPLDSWHLAQNFGALPTLSNDFIVENPPLSRVIAVITEPHFIFDAFFEYVCARPMPTYSTPGMVDHF